MTQATDIHDRIDDLVTRFQFFEDWKDRYQYLIDLGKKLPPFDEQWKTDDRRIHGCQSQVWLHVLAQDGRLHLCATSDAAIVSGLIALLLRVYDGATSDEILNTPLDFLGRIGLLQHLSPSRSNGLYNMIKYLHAKAKEAQS